MEKIAVSRSLPKDFYVQEALKVLRTNITFCGADVKAVGLTSFGASEGKTTICLQLACSLAQLGKRVLLMDADLRKSVLAGRLRVKGKVEGLSHYLSGLANVSELLRETDVDGLYIMFAGARVPNAPDLLSSEGFTRLIPALKDSFDYIIVDTAPLGQVVDCAVMASALDGIVMVVDSTKNSYKLERRIKAQLEKAQAKILGVVLNQVDYKDRLGYYGYGYGKRYGGYYYGSDKE